MKIPADFPVQPLKPGENVIGRATCGVCGLSWDDAKATEWTPAPSGRCPFEAFHEPLEGAQEDEDPQGYTADWQEEVLRLQRIIKGKDEVITNLMARNEQLQQLVLSYQQDNMVDYDEGNK